MGAFLLYQSDLYKNTPGINRLSEGLEVFSNMELSPAVVFHLGDYTLHLFQKKFMAGENYFKFDNGDLIASTGCLIYNGNYGQKALMELFHDFTSKNRIEDKCIGNYGVIIYHQNQLHIFRDYLGLYPVYQNLDGNVFSSSFLVVAKLLDTLSISKNELYEYVFTGQWASNFTLFKEIIILKEKGIHNLSDHNNFTDLHPKQENVNGLSYKEAVISVADELRSIFGSIHSAFGNHVRQGLSGGFDSRLILAGLLANNETPELYVNGTPGSLEIKCAAKIAEGLNIKIEEVMFYQHFHLSEGSITDKIMKRFYFFDGLGGYGVFNNYSDFEYRISNPNPDRIILNGVTGEMFREGWRIPLRSFRFENFLKARFHKFEYETICTSEFNKKDYFTSYQEKLSAYIGKNKKWLKRQDIDHLFKARSKGMSFSLSMHHLLNPFILPFYEPNLISKVQSVKVRWKLYGTFEKDLMGELYKPILKFQSKYGYSFDQKLSFKQRIKEDLTRNIPLSVRPLLRKYQKSRKPPVKAYGHNLVAKEIIDEIIGNPVIMSRYFNIDKINIDVMLSKIFTLELLFKNLKVNESID